MAGKLKDFFDQRIVRSIGRELGSVHARFDERSFVRTCMSGLEKLELTGRASKIADAMHEHLPRNFDSAARIISASLGPELERTDELGLTPFRYMPHAVFVARYGLEHFETSMRLQYELTKRFSAEFSIRAFLQRHPEASYERLLAWSSDPNVHVRRLVSEGTRPRLPWAARLREFQKDPRPVLRLLELLKDDPERYVQRSVANNLNDIGKDHPELLVEVCRRWSVNAGAGRRWIIGHALRSLVKRGDRPALATLGFASAPKLALSSIRISPRRAKLGSTIEFSLVLSSRAKSSQDLLVDYSVHFVKKNGSLRAKVFKLRKLVLAPGARAELEARISLEKLTTRQHYPGRHRIELLINGIEFPLGEFDVRS